MPRTHLPGHLDSAREKIRPRHQLLVLKCYPRLPKNATVDAKPNNSELSYLLYYCSTRLDKLPKVGAFLEQKTAYDVSHWQSVRVHVTLQILTAIVDHKEIGGRVSGFSLIAPYVLRIIREIINKTNDISLIEATTGTWDAFCQHQDVATLAADSAHRTLYEEVVRLYALLAKNNAKKLGKSTQPVAHHDATQLRKAGLAAIQSVFVPVELDRRWNSEFDNSFDAILGNLSHDSQRDRVPHDYLEHLLALSKSEEEERTSTANRRQSISTMRTFSGLPDELDPDPRAAEGTAQDADRLEEDEVGVLALDCLKAIFQSQNRGQVRGGAVAFMRYTANEEQRTRGVEKSATVEQWASILFRLITTWTPVQDRFILVVTAVEMLARFPLERSSSFEVAVLYNKVILSVLRSDLNLVGLSVIDILIGLINLTVRTSAMASHRAGSSNEELSRFATTVSQQRAAEELLPYLKDCMANLARHVYYSDQVTDLISFILLRVKASPPTDPPSEQGRPLTALAASLRDPKASANDVASTTSRPPTQAAAHASLRSNTFATEDGRQIALETVTDIIDIARSTPSYTTGSAILNRNRVPLGVWEGSQWLLRDPSPTVRAAYRAALLMWARCEADEGDDALIDFEADDCIEKLSEKRKPASLHGSIGLSHRSAHPQLLMLPAFGLERRTSSGKNSSNGTEDNGVAVKPRVRARDLKEIVEGRKQVPMKMGGGGEEPLDVTALLATIKIDPSRNGLSMAPPY